MMLVALAGWVNEQQLAVIEYLKEEKHLPVDTATKRCPQPNARLVIYENAESNQ